ncbi:MAG: Regulatory protein RecX [Candidatus Accumulibacter sp. BA-94]|jgi:regulatory protein|uniref:recombination regulator RecX n=1 Tax=Accumulibacter sp. TaxID=2053492 RepID=UPI000452D8C4|nr:recombination regulator RecX [Accumulibacter sp.]EXI89484.1 MAG: Regulatory protein RecX [Candidatus Accumulibacter sp. BA-94]MBL8392444.1 recombination regulator RecX [Accumulibacter sp.]HRD88498.1 recombination regulator RecX [Accumulibacter sp.]
MADALRDRALRLLARREHSRQELLNKLAAQAESCPELSAMLDDLSSSGLLSDRRYAMSRLRARAERFGDVRLAHELRAKGVADELVSEALTAAEAELTRARRVWVRRFGQQPADHGDAVERARQMRFLARRGFSTETIRRVLRAAPDDE